MTAYLRRKLAPVLLALATLAGVFAVQAVTAPEASAWTPVLDAWLLDVHGSTACYHDADQYNHGWCNSYPPGDSSRFITTAEWFIPGVGSPVCSYTNPPTFTSGSTGVSQMRLDFHVNSAFRDYCAIQTSGGFIESASWFGDTVTDSGCTINYNAGTTHDHNGALYTPGSSVYGYVWSQNVSNSTNGTCAYRTGVRLLINGWPG